MGRNIKKRKFGEPLPGLFDDDPEFSTSGRFDPYAGAEIEPSLLSGGSSYRRADAYSGDDLQPLEITAAPDRLDFISFGSGSSGNCAYVGDANVGILIDAGVSDEYVTATLSRYAIPMERVKGIILTHDHSDHVRYIYKLVRRYRHLQVFCTPRVLNGMLHRHNISRRIQDFHRAIYKEHPFNIGPFVVTAFETSHDGSDNAGFHIAHGHHNLVVATDMGRITERANFYIRQANYLMMEANYDAHMLATGRYPEYLKSRIRSEIGHLDNQVTAQYLRDNYSTKLRYIFLCHLSADNNRPEIALEAVTRGLLDAKASVGDGSNSPYAQTCDVQLLALPRYDATSLITLR